MERLADLLAEQGRSDELRARANAGDWYAARRLVDLLAKQGGIDELQARSNAGDTHAEQQLATLLVKQGNADAAIAILQTQADAGNWGVAQELAALLTKQGRKDEAIAILRAPQQHLWQSIRRVTIDQPTPRAARKALLGRFKKSRSRDGAEQRPEPPGSSPKSP